MDRYDITIGLGDLRLQERIKDLLRENSYQVEDMNVKGMSLIRSIKTSPPNLMLADIGFFGVSGRETLDIIIEDEICNIAVVVSENEKKLLTPGYETYEKTYVITKPINKNTFLDNIDIILKNIERVGRLEKQLTDLKEVLETRKLIDRAKAALMRNMKMTEQHAHRYLQKKSMESRMPMKAVALEVLKKLRSR